MLSDVQIYLVELLYLVPFKIVSKLGVIVHFSPENFSHSSRNLLPRFVPCNLFSIVGTHISESVYVVTS